MPIIDNCNFIFLNNNQFNVNYASLSVDSEQVSYPLTNAFTTDLYTQWKMESFFRIDSSNDTLYVNDGADQVASLTNDDYTGDELATEIQTQLNAVSSNWTCSYSSTTNKFTIGNSGSVTIQLSNQTNAAWFTIGFASIVNQAGTSFVAEEQRNHYPSISLTADFSYAQNIGACVLLSPLGTPFTLSESATITVEGDNLNFASTAALSKTMTVTDKGAFLFINDVESNYRYWRITIEDMYNFNGPEIAIGYLYLGYASQANERNVANGLTYGLKDTSKISVAENGSLYFDEKIKKNNFGNINIPLARKTTRDLIYELYQENGLTRPFIFSIDPKTEITNSIDDMTKLVRFASEPTFKHVKYDIFDISFTLEEVI